MPIWEFITKALLMFNDPSCFFRPEAFVWFVIAVLGIAIRSDNYGIASVIRSTGIDGKHYGALDNFFHALSWSLTPIRVIWHNVVGKYAHLETTDGRISLLIDHTKQSKEGRRMPGVQKLFQESETQSKPEYIHGFMFGGLSVVASRIGNSSVIVAIPLILQLQSGITGMLSWLDMSIDKLNEAGIASVKNMKRAVKDLEISTESSVTQMILLACRSAQWLKKDANIVADRAFLTLKALNAIDDNNQKQTYKVQLVTRCKKNLGVYALPSPREKGQKGPERKKGIRVYFDKLFGMGDEELRNLINPKDKSICWVKKTINMYGENKEVTFVSLNLVWARAHCRVLRFVLVKYDSVDSILVTTDLSMDAETVIRLYCTREKIEVTFRELKQCVHAFSARFWTSAMPKLNHFKKKTDPDPLDSVTSAADREKVALTVRAIELYAALSCIAIGLLQVISLSCEWKTSDFGWQRTSVDIDRPSEKNVQNYLRDRIAERIFRNSENEIGALLQKVLDKRAFEDIDKMMNVA